MQESTILSSPRPPAWPTLVQYHCTILTEYKTPLPTSRVYVIHHNILVITISCEGQVAGRFYKGQQIKKGSEPGECGADLLPFIVPPCDYPCTSW